MSIAEIDINTISVISVTQSQPGALQPLSVPLDFKRISRNVYLTIGPVVGDGASLDTTPIVFAPDTIPAEYRPTPGTILLGVVQRGIDDYTPASFVFDGAGGLVVTPFLPWTATSAGFASTILCIQTR